jgi:hypothetical protein
MPGMLVPVVIILTSLLPADHLALEGVIIVAEVCALRSMFRCIGVLERDPRVEDDGSIGW